MSGRGVDGNDSRWLVTYADLLTVLMVLFLVLWSISSVDDQKFSKFTEGLDEFRDQTTTTAPPDAAETVEPTAVRCQLPGGDTMDVDTDQLSPADAAKVSPTTTWVSTAGERVVVASPLPPCPTPTTTVPTTPGALQGAGNLSSEQLRGLVDQIAGALTAAGLPEAAGGVRVDDRGLVVSLQTDAVVFETGSANLSPSGQRIIAAVAPQLAAISNPIVVEGHTDTVPLLGRPGYDNWSLSADRALSVVRFLASTQIAPGRLSGVGFGEFRPATPGVDPGSLAKNRRVEILVLAAN